MNRIVKRMAVPVGAAIILGSSGFAFMAGNNVTTAYAGRGVGAISGYNVTGVSFGLDLADKTYPGDPALDKIHTVSFSLDHHASTVSAQIRDGSGGTWVPYANCGSDNGGYHWTCTQSTSQEASLAYDLNDKSLHYADALSVSAAQ